MKIQFIKTQLWDFVSDPCMTNTFDFFKTKREGNRIWMAYHNYATIKKDTLVRKAQWLESIIAIKKDTVWKLELMHSTRVNRN